MLVGGWWWWWWWIFHVLPYCKNRRRRRAHAVVARRASKKKHASFSRTDLYVVGKKLPTYQFLILGGRQNRMAQTKQNKTTHHKNETRFGPSVPTSNTCEPRSIFRGASQQALRFTPPTPRTIILQYTHTSGADRRPRDGTCQDQAALDVRVCQRGGGCQLPSKVRGGGGGGDGGHDIVQHGTHSTRGGCPDGTKRGCAGARAGGRARGGVTLGAAVGTRTLRGTKPKQTVQEKDRW